MPKLFPLLFALFCLNANLAAQNQLYFTQHRPDGITWQELKSPHFRIIYAQGDEDIARKAGRILESNYAQSFALTGGELSSFPVVLSPYNDLTNGFVSSVNFRSEVDLAPFKGKSLNPQSGLWLETVLPHELIHANHTNVTNPFSLARAFGFLSPDIRRSFNMFAPLGVHEGLAVYHESEHGLRPYSGRANYTYFTNQFNANLTGSNTWSMAQSLIISEYSYPNNRHYIGGSTFTKWLHQTYGYDISKRAIAAHQNFFFLGYGYALKHVTGSWPGQLYQQYIADKEAQETRRLGRISNNSTTFNFIGSAYKGVRQHAPIWISNTEIIYYSRQYNGASAFYLFDLTSGSHKKVSEHFVVSDFYFHFDQESQQLTLAEYFAQNRIYNSYHSDLVSLNVRTGADVRLTKNARLYSPTRTPRSLLALQTDRDVAAIVKVVEDQVQVLKTFENRHPVALKASNKDDERLAVLINERGVQALWVTSETALVNDLDNAPDLAFLDGSIHDPQWHPTENRILFSLDAYPAMNVFEFDLDDNVVTQITNYAYNAFEASYSPTGDSIAVIVQVNEEQKIILLERKNFVNTPINQNIKLAGEALNVALTAPVMGDELLTESELWPTNNYGSDISWLKPRAVLPVIKEKSGTNEWGAQLSSVDVLQSQMYSIELTGLQRSLWYNAAYTNKTFYPGIKVNLYREPAYVQLPISNTETTTLLQEERGVSIGIPFEYYFDSVERFTSLYIRPTLALEQTRLLSLTPTPINDFLDQRVLKTFAQFNYRILQRLRDVQPASGVQLFGQLEYVLNRAEESFTFLDNTYTQVLTKRNAFYLGANTFWAPFNKTNQTLKLSAQYLGQSDRQIFSNDTIIPMGFISNAFETSSSVGRFSTRYAVPLFYPDNGGLLIPFYLSTVYVSLFTHTLANFEQNNPFQTSSTVLGAGLHFQYKISNLAIDFGLGFTLDPTSGTTDFILGTF